MSKTLKKMQTINPWGVLSLILFIVLFTMLGYYGYVTMQAKRLNNVLSDKQLVYQQEQLKLLKLKGDSSYIRFQAAELVTSNFYGTDWKQRYEYLITVLNMLRQLDEKTGQAITLTDINVKDDKISLRGQVASMPKIYTPGGLIDQFVGLSFVEHITIPFYRKAGELYEFILDANIKTYDTVGGQI